MARTPLTSVVQTVGHEIRSAKTGAGRGVGSVVAVAAMRIVVIALPPIAALTRRQALIRLHRGTCVNRVSHAKLDVNRVNHVSHAVSAAPAGQTATTLAARPMVLKVGLQLAPSIWRMQIGKTQW